MRRVVHIVSIAMITAGIVVLLDVGMTLAWREPLSTVYGSIQQGNAHDELDELERSFFASPQARDASRRRDPEVRIRRLASVFADQVRSGQGIGEIEIPSIDLDAVIIQGTDTSSLREGPGHYPDTAFPGEGGTIAIAGHRTTYLAPFRNVDEIADGDEITLEMPYGRFEYTVQGHEIVNPSQVEVVDDVGYERLVLSACHPLYSAAQRWIVFARLTEVSRGAARDRTHGQP